MKTHRPFLSALVAAAILGQALVPSFAQAAFAVDLSKQATPQVSAAQELLPDTVKDAPFFFMAPHYTLEKSLKLIGSNEKGNPKNPAIIFDIRATNSQMVHKGEVASIPLNQVKPEQLPGQRITVMNYQDTRENAMETLANSGVLQTGDVVLSYRAGWAGGIEYGNMQMGLSHTSIAYIVQDGDGKYRVHNVDMPLDNDAFRDDKGNNIFSAPHYIKRASNNEFSESHYLHILRPRELHEGPNAAKYQSNVREWLKLTVANAKKIYPAKVSFNKNYAVPLYREGKPLTFVQTLARLAKGDLNAPSLQMYCSEFVWSILSLRKCDPKTNDALTGSCISPVFHPHQNIGTALNTPHDSKSPLTIGLGEGPGLVASSMVPRDADGTINLQAVPLLQALMSYTVTSALDMPNAKYISSGHKDVNAQMKKEDAGVFEKLNGLIVAQQVQQKAAKLPAGALNGTPFKDLPAMAAQGRTETNAKGYPNYSPTSFFLEASLPDTVPSKSFNYVTTVVFAQEDNYKAIKANFNIK